MMNRRELLITFGLCTLAFPLRAGAQPADKVWRIGFLNANARPADGAPPALLREALQEYGYRDGTNISFVARWAEGKIERLPALAADIVGLKVDLIVVTGGPATLAMKQASSTIPIVFVNAGDAVETGLVSRLDRPGKNITGLNDQASELSAKRLEILKEVVPKASRIAVIWNETDLAMSLRYVEIGKAARLLRVTIQPLAVREPDDLNGAFAAMMGERPDALLIVADSLTSLNRKRIIDYAAAQRIPAMFEFDSFARAGGLMAYGANQRELWRRMAAYVDQVLKGAKPADLPVEQPTKFELVINKKTAKALGITIPQSVLLRADEVIE